MRRGDKVRCTRISSCTGGGANSPGRSRSCQRDARGAGPTLTTELDIAGLALAEDRYRPGLGSNTRSGPTVPKLNDRELMETSAIDPLRKWTRLRISVADLGRRRAIARSGIEWRRH